MVDFDYLYKGLCGLANAHKASALAGHLGAAVVAGYFWGEDLGGQDDAVYRGVEKELDRVMKGEEAFWFNSRKAGITAPELFKPLPEEEPQEALIADIAKALSSNIGKTRQSGHNVIFAAIAIRALHDHPLNGATFSHRRLKSLRFPSICGFEAGPGRARTLLEGWRRHRVH